MISPVESTHILTEHFFDDIRGSEHFFDDLRDNEHFFDDLRGSDHFANLGDETSIFRSHSLDVHSINFQSGEFQREEDDFECPECWQLFDTQQPFFLD